MQLLLFHLIQFSAQVIGVLAAGGPFADTLNYYTIAGLKVNYKKYIAANKVLLIDSTESNITFLLSDMFIVASIMAFMITKPWKKEFYTYLPFTIPYVIVALYTALLYIVPALRPAFFHLTHINSATFCRFLLLLGLSVGFLIIFIQKCVLIPLFRWIDSRKTNKR